MAALATPAELATYLQTATQDEWDAGNPDALDTLRATQLLDNASANIRDECGWSITTEVVTAQRIPARKLSAGFLILPTLNLTAFALTIDAVTLVNGTDYVWDPSGRVDLITSRTVLSTTVALATYTHGYATAPGPRDVCLELAAADYVNPSSYLSETIGETVTVYPRRATGAPIAGSLQNDSRLNAYRLPPGVA